MAEYCTPPDVLAAAKSAEEELIPKKSESLYTKEYSNFNTWRNEKRVVSISENAMLAYFAYLSKDMNFKPSSLWAKYSMLKTMIKTRDNINIASYYKVSAYLKKESKGYVGKKSMTLEAVHIQQYLEQAPDEIHLLKKIKAAAPKMDRNGYFSYIASTAKKKKINLMQSRPPREAFIEVGGAHGPIRRESEPKFDISAPTAVDELRRVLMSHRVTNSSTRARRSDYSVLESYQPIYHHVKAVPVTVDQYHQIVKSGAQVVVVESDVKGRRRHPQGQQQPPQSPAIFVRASHKLQSNSSPHRRRRHAEEDANVAPPNGFCATLQKFQPPAPPSLLRRLGVKETTGVGKVKVMLRVSGAGDGPVSNGSHTFTLDKRKKQVTLYETPTQLSASSPAPEDRKVGVSAPKMFAFDAIFSQDDPQTDICSGALADIIHAVINGTDGCLFCFGHAGIGKSFTMIGAPEPSSIGAMPCAISWLFRGIAEQKHKCGTRFSVRVSAVEVCGHTNQLRDLLQPYQNDTEQSPGIYLRDDPLFGTQLQNQSELRVHTPEKAAFYLDAALAARSKRQEGKDSHLLYTLHVYQYNVGGKGAVAGGRSRLHLIDLGNSERGKSNGGIPLSGLGNILLAIFNGQRHLPYRDHSLTHVLRECLGSLTCHTAMIVHVAPKDQNYTDTLTTLQLASRIHRLRRRKMKFSSANNAGSGGSSGEDAAKGPSSSEPDPSSSDLSADTVIYVGPIDDATDGEHPPVYIPNINSGDNRGVLSKALRGSAAEHRGKSSLPKVVEERSTIHRQTASPRSSPAKHSILTHSPKHPPLQNPILKTPQKKHSSRINQEDSKSKSPSFHSPIKSSDEQWIDGPKVSKSKLVEVQHILKENVHTKKLETWVDGPKQPSTQTSPLHLGALNSLGGESIGYGYMDNHKKSMIRKWVENQTQLYKSTSKPSSPSHRLRHLDQKEKHMKNVHENECEKLEPPIKEPHKCSSVEESVIRTGLKTNSKNSGISEEPDQLDINEIIQNKDVKAESIDEDDDSEELAEIPPPLPIISPLSSREPSVENMSISRRQVHSGTIGEFYERRYQEDDEILEIIEVEEHLEAIPVRDMCLQVTEEDIALCCGYLPEEHPLSVLSRENLTLASTFTDSMSICSDVERQMRADECLRRALNFDVYSDCDLAASRRVDWLSGLRDLYMSRLALASRVIPDAQQLQSVSMSNVREAYEFHGDGSVYSEPPYRPNDSVCNGCGRTNETEPNIYTNNDNYRNPNETLDPYTSVSVGAARLASLRHPDGASDPNLREEKPIKTQPRYDEALKSRLHLEVEAEAIPTVVKPEKTEVAYDSGHESTPRTSKHSPAGTSRRAESGYASVLRDSDVSSIDSYGAKTRRAAAAKKVTTAKYKTHNDSTFCSWLRNPFACKYPDTDPEISDF